MSERERETERDRERQRPETERGGERQRHTSSAKLEANFGKLDRWRATVFGRAVYYVKRMHTPGHIQ